MERMTLAEADRRVAWLDRMEAAGGPWSKPCRTLASRVKAAARVCRVNGKTEVRLDVARLSSLEKTAWRRMKGMGW